MFADIASAWLEVIPVFAVFAVIALAWPDVIPVFAVFAVIALAWPDVIPVFAVFAVIALAWSAVMPFPSSRLERSTVSLLPPSIPIVRVVPSKAEPEIFWSSFAFNLPYVAPLTLVI